ncbi:tetratricopeptide repeat protein [Paenibacillus pini]|uniref:TPR repeat protein n=1 Tax=Paenibacillus pini JCM 16418 TaxID=1236976 RepID=W7YPY3_9BACL|nr:tetratricopeptide repeat protein [Paenibacillus pini]GAF06596.1 TPR repeat protein [Paenibacillus pini JCM 16418]
MNLYDKGDQLYYEQKFSEAANVFMECIELEVDKIDSMNYLGCCELQLGNYEKAHHWFDQAMVFSPEWGRLYSNKSRVFMKQGDFSKAAEYLYQSLELNDEDEDTLYYLGVFYESQDKLEKAREAYLASLEINPNQPETILNYGIVEVRLGHIEEGKKQFKSLMNWEGYETYAYWNLTCVYKADKQYSKALECLNSYISLNNDVDEEANDLLKELQQLL